eukprot:jgi/Chlat1/6141/Chrsp41S05693
MSKKELSYRYWTSDAASSEQAAAKPPAPKQLSQEEAAQLNRTDSAGSIWNQAGTWEEKNVTEWARSRLKAILFVVRGQQRFNFDFDVTTEWAGTVTDDDNTVDVVGTFRLPDLTPDELDSMEDQLDLSVRSSSEAAKRLALATAKHLVGPLEKRLREFEKELKQMCGQ